MATLDEKSEWVDGVYQFELDDAIVGGPDGVDNLPHKQLANRTQYLKQELDRIDRELKAIADHSDLASKDYVVGTVRQSLNSFHVCRIRGGDFTTPDECATGEQLFDVVQSTADHSQVNTVDGGNF